MSKQERSLFLSQIKKSFAGSLNTKTVVAFLVFGMIIAVFVLSDLSGRGGGNIGLGAAATVNGQIISLKQFQEQETRISNYYAQLFGGQFDKMFQKGQLMSQAMNELVNNMVAEQAAGKEYLFATDAEIRAAILEIPAFKKEGVFQSDLYKGLLSANRLTPAEFETALRQQVALQKVRDLFIAGYQPLVIEKTIENDLKSAQINIQYIKLNFESFNSPAAIPDAEVTTKLSNPEFKKKVLDYYNQNAAEFSSPEQIKASHILIKANSQDLAATEKARVKAEDLLKQLVHSDFAKVAAKNSEDPASKVKGGDLGYFTKGSMVPEFEDVAFKLQKGQISDLVKTQFGFHIIKLFDRKPASKTPENTAHLKIGRKILAEEKYLTLAKEVEAQISKNPAEIEPYLLKNKLTWVDSGYYNLVAETVPQVNSSALFKASLELTRKSPYSKNLVREGDSQYLVKLKDMKKAPVVNTVPDQMDQNAQQKSMNGYQKWVNSYKKLAKIETNELLLKAQE